MNLSPVIKTRLGELGAALNSAQLQPFVEPIIRPKADILEARHAQEVKKLDRELETAVGKLITDRVLAKAFKNYTASQKEKLNQQPTQKELNYASSSQQ